MAQATVESSSARVRARLDHPVVDADGHWLEPIPLFLDFLKEDGGQSAVDDARKHMRRGPWYQAAPEERIRSRITRPQYWALTGNTLDRATGMLPELLYRRLDDFGIDFVVLMPSLGGRFAHMPQRDLRRVCVRAYNRMAAELWRPYADRIAPVGVSPNGTPQEAIEECEFMVKQLGIKAVRLGCIVTRPVEADADWQPEPGKRRQYVDCLGIDSPYDYDPLWAKLTELKLAVLDHSQGFGWGGRTSPTNMVFNHTGHFANAHYTAACGLFLGGVTQRFPKLNFAFLEGGAAWASNLCLDLIGHWEKRNRQAMRERLNPSNLDTGRIRELFEQYADDRLRKHIDDILEHNLDLSAPFETLDQVAQRAGDSDDFARLTIGGPDDIRRLFTSNFYFGCEADDPTAAWAFDPRMRLPLKAMFSSDISHFDVPDSTEVLEEAWELVEHGLITEADFRKFTFSNVVQLHGGMNPDFFRGTRVEQAAGLELAAAR